MKNYKELYREKLNEYRTFYSTLEASKLKPASGELREYQLKIFEFAKKMISIFEKQQIRYFLIGGTLIGAIRHNGFVPWDDDFDLGMMREDYDKMLEFCKNNYICIDPKEISFATNNRTAVWAKYLKKYPNKIIYSQTPHHTQILCGTDIENFVNIDVFPHDYYSETIDVKDYNKYMDYINEKKCLLGRYDKIIEFFNSERFNNPIFDKKGSVIFYGLDNIDNYILPRRGFFRKETFFPLKKIKFEDAEVFVQNKPFEYAELQYKNYMQMPSDIEISPHIKCRKNDLIKHEIVNLKTGIYNCLLKLCFRNINEKNVYSKQLVMSLIEAALFDKKGDEKYKELYEQMCLKLEFIKSIS